MLAPADPPEPPPLTIDRVIVQRVWHAYDDWRGRDLPQMTDTYEIARDDPIYEPLLARLREIDAERSAAHPSLPFF